MDKVRLIISMIIIMMLMVSCTKKISKTEDSKEASALEAIPVQINESYENLSYEDLCHMNDNAMEVQYHASTRIPWEIRGIFSTQIIKSEQDALRALLSVRDFFHIADYEYYCSSYDTSRSKYDIYTLNQLYRGVLIENGFFQICITKDGTPASVKGAFQKVSDMDTSPAFSKEDARDCLDLEREESVESTTLVIYTDSHERQELCWKFKVSANNDGMRDRDIYISAITGELIAKVPLSIS